MATNQPDPPPIPGQMDLYEVLAEVEQEKTVDKPKKASVVQPSTELSEDELRKQKTRNVVAGRLARTTALKRNGVDLVSQDASLADKLDHRLRKIDKASYDSHKAGRDVARAAVQAKLQAERDGLTE